MQRTEWQISEMNGENVITGLSKKEAMREFNKNPEATHLIKVVWKFKDYPPLGYDPRKETIVKVKDIRVTKNE